MTGLPQGATDITPTSTPLIYLGAVGRSGTTLIERALASEGHLVALGEMCHFWERSVLRNEPCGCGEPIRDCPLWTKIVHQAFGGWDHLDGEHVRSLQQACDRNRFIPALIWPRLGGAAFRRSLEEFSAVLARLYAAIAAVAEPGQVLIDSSKHPSYLFLLRHVAGIDVRLLHVVRDPRGVAHSWGKVVARAETGGADDMERLDPWHAGARWTSHHLLFTLAGRRHRRERLVYERFSTRPDELSERVESLVADTGVRAPRWPDSVVQLSTDHTVSGNPVRFATGTITIRPDQAWRSALGRRSRAIVDLLTLPLRLVLCR